MTLPSGASAYCNQGFKVLSVTFDNPTSFVSFETMWRSDPVWVYAYNAAGELVTVSVSSAASDIAWIIAGSDSGVAGIDRMTFESTATSVPEPATFGLLLAGLAGGLLARRKARASTKN